MSISCFWARNSHWSFFELRLYTKMVNVSGLSPYSGKAISNKLQLWYWGPIFVGKSLEWRTLRVTANVSHFRCCAPDSPAKAKLSCQFSWPSKVKLTFWTEKKKQKKKQNKIPQSQLVQFAAEQLSWRLERGDKSQGAKKGAVLYVLMSNFKGLQMPPGVLHSVSNVAVFGIK